MKDIAITAMTGIFPGADNVELYWQNILNARVAPLTMFEKGQRIARKNYKGEKFNQKYSNGVFCLPDQFSYAASDDVDRQVMLARRIVSQCLANLKTAREKVGLVAGTAWTSPNYFERDIELLFDSVDKSSIAFPSAVGMHVVEEQMSLIARSLHIGGPCLAVDAACASSLYAIDTGMCLLQSGQAKAVIVLGLNAYIPSFVFTGFEKLAAFSKDGAILPFSSQASGLMLGECVGAVVIETLDGALSEGRPILGIIRSTGFSTQGAERSVFAPGSQGQNLAYQRAYQSLDPGEIDYVEAHGTATVVGDQTEITVLDQVFGSYFKNDRKLPIGSVKSLIGHTLAAAGMASLIKALLMLRERIIPPHIPIDTNPMLAETCMQIPAKAAPWKQLGRPARIGISAFGFGGANAHLVLEAFDNHSSQAKYRAAPSRAIRKENDSRKFSPLAIVDFEAAFGPMINVPLWGEKIKEGKKRFCPFPWERFHTAGEKITGVEKEVLGSFFPDQFMMDISGLRMGPASLCHVDPFQLLVTQLVRVLLDRNPTIKESNESGVVFCNNMGGAMPLKLIRKEYLLHEKNIDDIETTLEEVASGLPNMCSGYPARHFNLKAFHQTLSGGNGIFWTSLINAEVWLKEHCTNLLLGAGRFVKSPVDLLPLYSESNKDIPIGEGFGVFLVKTMEQAVSDGDKVLAVVQDIVPAAMADTFEKACQVVGIEPSIIEIRESSQLSPEWLTTAEGASECVQTVTGFMGEATGVEALSKVLITDGRLAAIEVRSGEKLLMTVFLEKRNKCNNQYEPPQIPMEVVFQNSISEADSSLPDSSELSVTQTSILESLITWQQSSADIIKGYMAAQRKTLSLLDTTQDESMLLDNQEASNLDDRLLSLRRDPSNIVLNSVRYDYVRRVYTGELKVDESHPYFFDHPLDHVPGILVLEGILQLTEIAALDNVTKLENQDFYVKTMDISFKRYCEKSIPIIVELSVRESGSGELFRYQASVLQGGKISCESSLAVAYIDIKALAEKHTSLYEGKLPEKEILHKFNIKNVLTSNIEMNRQGYTCNLLDPSPGHVLQEGNKNMYSALYLTEVMRQFIMQIGHLVKGIPLGLPMALLSVKLFLNKPAQRFVPLTLTWEEQPVTKVGSMIVANMKSVLKDQFSCIGEASILVQIMDAKIYAEQRGLKNADKV